MAPSVESIYHSATGDKFGKFDKLGADVAGLASSWKYGGVHGATLYSSIPTGKYVPERPEPIYPAPFKRGTYPLSGDARDLSANFQRSFYSGSPGGVGHGPTPGTSSAGPGLPPRHPSASPSASAMAAAAFLRGAFPGSYPTPGHPAPHPAQMAAAAAAAAGPHQHPFPAGQPSTASIMSLAHILFQPKYPMGKKTFRCHQCRYLTDRKNNLKRHISTMHQDCGKFLECCDTIFRSKAALRDHVLLFHRAGYKCRFCGRNFCRKALLKRHLTVHNGQKDFICTVCDYATSHKSNLERHRKVHGLGSPYGSEDGDHVAGEGPGDLQEEDFMRYSKEEAEDEDEDEDEEDGEDTDEESMITVNSDTPVYPPLNVLEGYDSTLSPMTTEGSLRDPLLNATPVISHGKRSTTMKTAHRKFTLPDRLRQTYEDDCNMDTEAEATPSQVDITDDRGNLPETPPNHLATPPKDQAPSELMKRDAGMVRSQLEVSPKRTRSAGPRQTRPGVDTNDRRLRRARPHPTPGRAYSPPDQPAPSLGGYRRLYASPYKCSECGISLATQQTLLQHSTACRRPGIAPQRPINAILADTHLATLTNNPKMERLVIPLPHDLVEDKPVELSFCERKADRILTSECREADRSIQPREMDTSRFTRVLDDDSNTPTKTNSETISNIGVAAERQLSRRAPGEAGEDGGRGPGSPAARSPSSSSSSTPRSARLSPSIKDDDGKFLPIKKRSVNHYNV